MNRSWLAAFVLALSGCEAEPEQDSSFATEKSPFAEGSREARAAVAFLNDAATDAARLKSAGLSSTSTANAVLSRRNGPDGQLGTSDDRPFVTLGEFDAIKGIGPATISKVAAYARARSFGNERGRFHEVYFTEQQADLVLDLANTASVALLDSETSVDSRALKNIEAARPILSMAELASLSRVKGTALRLLRDHAYQQLGPIVCTHEEPCASGLFCTDSDNTGHCVDTSVDGSGQPCSADGACGPELVCAGRAADFSGICNPAWMHAEFVNEGSGSIPDGPDGGVGVSVQALGIGTVPTDAVVRVLINHPRPDDLELTLENSQGTVVPVWSPGMGELPDLEGIKVGVPGDEVANGMWTLTVFDTVAGEQGTIDLFTLELTSRFD